MTAMSKTAQAVMEGRALYQNKVKSVADMTGSERAIKRSTNSKLGKRISKGKWAGFPLYTLTLEERRTCPMDCAHWADCYGNNMRNAVRYQADAHLIPTLWKELTELQAKHPGGFAVRLHVLGDFYSADYVGMWATAMDTFPALHVFGYSARHHGAIGLALARVAADNPDRWRVRISGWSGAMGALSADAPQAEHVLTTKAGFICPEQTGKTETCGTCGACWSTRKAVLFLTH